MGMDIYYHAIENEDVAIFKKENLHFMICMRNTKIHNI